MTCVPQESRPAALSDDRCPTGNAGSRIKGAALAAALAVLIAGSAALRAPAAEAGGYGVDCATKTYLISRLPDSMHVIADLEGAPAASFVVLMLREISAASVLVIANPETRLAGVYGFDDEGCAYPDGYVLPLGKAERLLDRVLTEDRT